MHAAVAIREVGADREKSDIGREAAANLGEAVEVCGVAGVIDGVVVGSDDVASEAAVGVVEHARSPVATGSHGNAEAGDVEALPPLHGVAAAETKVGDEIFNAVGNDDLGSAAVEAACGADDAAQRGDVEVVHVGVGDKDGVDGGKVLDEDAGAALTAEEDEAGSEYGIDEDVAAGDLKEEGGMPDEGDPKFGRRDEFGWAGLAGEGVLVTLLDDTEELTYLPHREGPSFPEFFYRTFDGAHTLSRCG